MAIASFNQIADIVSSAMNAETVRLNTVASNLANAGIAGAQDTVYQARKPVFATVLGELGAPRVQVLDIIQSAAPARKAYEPDHPLADEEGYVFYPNVNSVEEMTDMLSSSRAFQTNIEVLNRVIGMQQATLKLLEG